MNGIEQRLAARFAAASTLGTAVPAGHDSRNHTRGHKHGCRRATRNPKRRRCRVGRRHYDMTCEHVEGSRIPREQAGDSWDTQCVKVQRTAHWLRNDTTAAHPRQSHCCNRRSAPNL